MAAQINFNSITVILADRRGKNADLIQQGFGQNAAQEPLLSGITYDDDAMHGLAKDLQDVVTNSKLKPPTATTADVAISRNIIVDAQHQNAGEIQSIARKAAKNAGDVNVGIDIVEKAGYILKKPKSSAEKTFEVDNDGPGTVTIDTKAVAHHATYIREFGRTSAENVVPEPEDIEKWLVSPESDIRAEGLQRLSWYAFREASVLPKSRKANNSAPATKVEKKATGTLTGKAHRRVYRAGTDANYKWGPWIWVFIV